MTPIRGYVRVREMKRKEFLKRCALGASILLIPFGLFGASEDARIKSLIRLSRVRSWNPNIRHTLTCVAPNGDQYYYRVLIDEPNKQAINYLVQAAKMAKQRMEKEIGYKLSWIK